MMWAMRMVVRPVGIPMAMKRVSRLEPMTTSGVAIGMKMSRFVADRPWKRWRPRAKAIIVPRTVATREAMSPTCRLSPSALQMPGGPHGLSHASSVGWARSRVRLYRPLGRLKE